MRNLKLLTVLFAALLLTFSACKKDDDPPMAVEINSLELSSDNTELTVNFNQGVYRNADKTGRLENDNFEITFYSSQGITAQYSVSHTAGEQAVTINFVYEEELVGDERIEVTALKETFYGSEGNSVDQDLTADIDVN